MNRLASFLLAAGLLAQVHSVYLQAHEPVLPLVESRAPAISPRTMAVDPAPSGLEVTPLAQQTSGSQGQACVAMAVNFLTGKKLDENDINAKYGYELLRALRQECAEVGYDWKDGGEVGPDCWELIEHKVQNEQSPVLLALNGPEFSPSGRGHIVLVSKVEGEKVTFADPATGTFRSSTRGQINAAPQHPQGNFIFYADRMETR